MNTQRLATCFFLFLIVIAIALPLPRYAENPRGLNVAEPDASATTSTTVGNPQLPSPKQTQQTAATIIRTIVYRRISDFQEGGGISNINRIKLSADGSKIIFISGQKIFTMDATGQNLRQVFDAGNQREPYWIDISANGAKIIWATGYGGYFYTADSDGSNRIAINPGFKTNYGSDDILGLAVGPRITADGSRVYFTHSGALENTGAYQANVNNTGFARLFSFVQMAALFGKDGSVYNGNTAFSSSLVISDEGSRLVVGTANFDNLGQTVAYDSTTGLHKLTNYLASYADRYIAISGDGSTVVVVGATGYPENRSPAFAMDFSGTNSREIIHDMNAFGSAIGVMEMTTNGAQVLSNAGKTTSILYTDGSGRLDLNVFQCSLPFADPVGGANAGHDANPIFGQSLTADGRRFAFVSRQAPNQIWVADINPSTPGDAPVISEVNFNPTWVLADGSTSSTFTARVTGGQGGIRFSCFDSLKNNSYQFRAFSGNLYDNGTNGDATAADSRYTNSGVRRDLAAADPVSPYAARIYGYADSLRQITAVDAVPFFILNTPPAGSGPHIDAITPSSGTAGIQVKVTGSGFDPVPTNNIVLFGNRQAYVKSANSARTELEVIVPPDLAPGVYAVTVTVAAQTSNAVNFAVTGDTSCSFTISPVSQKFAANGGTGIVSVTANKSTCAWTATNNASFITVLSGTPGTGNGAVNYSVATNTGSARTGTITIAGQTFTITQDAGATVCTYSISPTSQSFAAAGGTGSINVTTQPGCVWTATSNAGWIAVTAGTPGQGSGTINYSVAANTSSDSRTGTITIAGLTFTVTQAGTGGGGPLIRIQPTTLNFTVPKSQTSAAAQASAAQSAPERSEAARTQSRSKPDRDAASAFPRPENEHEPEGELRQDFQEWFYQQREYPLGQIPEGALRRAWEFHRERRSELRAAQEAAAVSPTQWSFMGPAPTTGGRWNNVSGRVSTIVVHPTDPNTVYVGGAQGGVWRTQDNGTTWAPLTDNQVTLAMGALALDPANPNVIYAGTGEQHFSLDSYYGNGILKSTDGGASWSLLGADIFARQTISRVLVSQGDSQIVFATASRGLYRSANGGASWTLVLTGSSSIATDIVGTPAASNTFYAAIYGDGVYKSTDGGATWAKLGNGLPTGNICRVHLAVSASLPNTLLAVYANTEYLLGGLYRTTDGGASWTRLGNTPEVFGGQGFYNISLAIHPANPNIYYLGGVMLWRSMDGGATWSNVSNPNGYQRDVHPDQHAIAFNPQNPAVLWIGNDGGVWRSDNGGDAWINCNNGLGIMQFQSVALHPTDDRIAYGGTQDNGTQRYSGDTTWREIFGGDGGATIVDFGNPTTVFTTYIYGNMARSSDSGSTWFTATGGIPISNGRVDARVGFYAPFTMDPSSSQRLAFGSYRVWYTTNSGDNWTNISGDLTGGGLISAVTIAAGGARIWVGTSDAQVWRGDFSNGSWNWTNSNKAPLPGRYVTRIAAHPTDPQTAYVSYSGFDTDHVFRTSDGGATWTNASAGLPNLPVNAVLIDPNIASTVYAGTDIGVYRSLDQGQSWTPFGTNLPNVAIFDLAINKNSGVLRVATHGRGMWEIQTGGEQGVTIFNDGSSTLRINGIAKQNNSAWLSFTPPLPIPFDIAPGASVTVRVNVNAAGLNPGTYADRLLVTSNDAPRSPYPDGVYVNLTVAGATGCTFNITPGSQSLNANGGTGTVSVTAAGGCLWTATSNDTWISIVSGTSGSGNGTLSFSVAANPNGAARNGTMTIAGITFTVAQAGGSNFDRTNIHGIWRDRQRLCVDQ